MSTTLYLMRHGPTIAAPGSLIGSSDVPISGSGLDRLDAIIPMLENVECWYCSPMLRCVQSLDALRNRGCAIKEIRRERRLREIDFGQWEEQTFAAIARTDPGLVRAWQQYEDFVFPGGEAVTAFSERVREMLEAFTTLPEKEIGVMTHGGVIRTMICLALGISVRNYLLFDVRPAALTILEMYTHGGVLRGLNL